MNMSEVWATLLRPAYATCMEMHSQTTKSNILLTLLSEIVSPVQERAVLWHWAQFKLKLEVWLLDTISRLFLVF